MSEETKPQRIQRKRTKGCWYGHPQRWLCRYFGEAREAESITAGEAKDFYRHVLATRSPAYAGMIIRVARQVYRDAIDRKQLTENPFDGIKIGQAVNAARQRYISLADTLKIMDACPNADWRLIVALCRYAGLRCPSEVSGLNVMWDRNRMKVGSPKTERYTGQDFRIVPIFGRLLPHLRESFELAEAGSEYVVPRRKFGQMKLRTEFERIVARSGLTPWPRLFHNMRSSCQTDLVELVPEHAASM